jgi:protein-S-isoprenylcysteine O-methyltransferase Ste14
VRPFLAFKILLFTLLVPGAVLIYMPFWLLSDPNGNLQPANFTRALPAGFCIILGLAIYLRCAWDFAVKGSGTPAPIDPPKKLVVSGLYRRTRNPMFQGVLLVLLAECLLFADHPALLVYVGSIALFFHITVLFREEPDLASRFGTSYSHYCRQVPRWGFAVKAFSSGPV